MPVTIIPFCETVRVSVQEVLFGFQGAMVRFCRLLPGRICVQIKFLGNRVSCPSYGYPPLMEVKASPNSLAVTTAPLFVSVPK
jgi:hypothetical protein